MRLHTIGRVIPALVAVLAMGCNGPTAPTPPGEEDNERPNPPDTQRLVVPYGESPVDLR